MEAHNNGASWLVILNPAAGSGRTRKAWPRICKLLEEHKIDFGFEETLPSRRGDVCIAEGLDSGVRKFICVGGDGHLHDMVNGLFSQDAVDPKQVILAIISTGTGNDWARNYGLHNHIERSVKAISAASVGQQTIGVASGFWEERPAKKYFHNFAGVGFDAEVVYCVSSMKRFGRFAYFLGLIMTLTHFRKRILDIQADGEHWKGNVYMVMAGIGKFSGGGMKIMPHADVGKPLLALTVAGDFSPWEVLKNLRRLYNGTLLQHKHVESRFIKNIKLDAGTQNKTTWMEADGEPVGHGPFEIGIDQRKLNIIIPK